MVKSDLIKNGRYDEIERLSREAIGGMLNLRISYTHLPEQVVILTDNVSRAVYYMEQQGIEFDMSSAKYDGERLISVEFAETKGNRTAVLME